MAFQLVQEEVPRPARRIRRIGPPAFSALVVFSHLPELWRYRDLLFTLSIHRIKVRYKQSVLGVSWAVLQPLSLMLIYTVVFSLVAKVPSEGAPYAVFAYAALLPWTCFSTALTNATNGLVSHQQLVTKVYFPREILPLTYVFASVFDLLIGSTVLAALMVYYHVSLTWHLLYAIPIVVLLVALSTSVSLVFSATQVRIRDIGMAMPLLLQLWMFVSPVVYPLSSVPQRFRTLYLLNPMAGIIESFRRVVVLGTAPDWSILATALVITGILLPTSYMYFKRVESTVADLI